MKKITILLLLILLLFTIVSCSNDNEILSTRSPMAMVKDEIYLKTEEISIEDENIEISGNIKSSVKNTEKPKKNEESNFGKGNEYGFFKDGLVVNIDDKWIFFEKLKKEYSKEEEKAIDNSLKYIDNSFFKQKDKIDIDMIKIEKVEEDTWEIVKTIDNEDVEKEKINNSDWIITIGDTIEHDFIVIVCSSKTGEVIGYIPIK